jgi:hypothetical protein
LGEDGDIILGAGSTFTSIATVDDGRSPDEGDASLVRRRDVLSARPMLFGDRMRKR